MRSRLPPGQHTPKPDCPVENRTGGKPGYNGSGNYCGTRKSCGYLNGTCDATTLYYCPGGNGLPATWKGQCPGYCMETSPGLDACPLRKQLIPKAII